MLLVRLLAASTRITTLTLWSIASFNVGTPSATLTMLPQTFIGRCRTTLMIGSSQSLSNGFGQALSWCIVHLLQANRGHGIACKAEELTQALPLG